MKNILLSTGFVGLYFFSFFHLLGIEKIYWRGGVAAEGELSPTEAVYGRGGARRGPVVAETR